MKWLDPPPLSSAASLPGLHPLVAQTLLRRGLTTPEAARAFLDPGFYTPARPEELPGLAEAVERLEKAIRSGEPICVWGDFDVDGQTSTAILLQALLALGAHVTYHVPVREGEGHGVNIPTLQKVIERGAQLVLTCDTGISAQEAVEYARTRGVEMIITDHHELPETLPRAAAIVNPKLLPAEHPLATLSGAGVAYKLAEALLGRRNEKRETGNSLLITSDSLLDLTALGLVADLASLRGDTRYLVQRGLEALRNTRRLGLQTIFELAGLQPANINEEHIGFVLGPRLNALGRLGDANPAVELFLTPNPARARLLATQLENYNAQRQLLTSQVTRAAEAQLQAAPALLAQPVLILANPAWAGGVIGIAAARLVERYHKPAILFATPAGEPARGSARSVEGLDITRAIAAQADLLISFGGHPMAAGLALDQDRLPEFQRRMMKTAEQMLGETLREEPALQVDAWLELPELSLDLAAALEQLAPYGQGNEKLVLACRGLTLRSTAAIGRNKEHLKLSVADEAGNVQEVLWWNGSGETPPEGKFDLAYTLRASDWRGSPQVQVEFVGFRIVEEAKIELPGRKLDIVDFRLAKEPLEVLKSLPAGTLTWAEAEEKTRIGGVDRNGLTPAAGLAIWSIPPSPEELHVVLEKVRPQTIYLIAAHPPIEHTENFMARLTGLLKYAINQRGGQVTYDELAAATGQRLITVQRGVGYLIAHGNIILQREAEGQLILAAGATQHFPGGAARLWIETQSLLAETAAYRAHFKRAEKETLFS